MKKLLMAMLVLGLLVWAAGAESPVSTGYWMEQSPDGTVTYKVGVALGAKIKSAQERAVINEVARQTRQQALDAEWERSSGVGKTVIVTRRVVGPIAGALLVIKGGYELGKAMDLWGGSSSKSDEVEEEKKLPAVSIINNGTMTYINDSGGDVTASTTHTQTPEAETAEATTEE